MKYIKLQVNYEEVYGQIKGQYYRSKVKVWETKLQKGDQVLDLYDLKTPTNFVAPQTISLPFKVPTLNRELYQKALQRYGSLKIEGEVSITELPYKSSSVMQACMRGYYLFKYDAGDMSKAGILLNGNIQINQQFFTLNRLENKMGILIYKNTEEGLRWQKFFLNLLSLKAYYFIVAQGRGEFQKSVLDFLQAESCPEFTVDFPTSRFRQLVEITARSYEIGGYICAQFLQNALFLTKEKGCKQVAIRRLPDVLKRNYRLPIEQFGQLRVLELRGSITKGHLKSLQTYLRQDGSDNLVSLDISENELRGGIGRLFQAMTEKMIVELQMGEARRQHMLLYYGLAETMMDDNDVNKMIQSFDRINKKLLSTPNFSYAQKCTIDISRNSFQPKKLTFISSFVSNYHGVDRLVMRQFGSPINRILFNAMEKNIGMRVLDLRDNRIENEAELMHMLMHNYSLEQLLITKTDNYDEELLPYFSFELI